MQQIPLARVEQGKVVPGIMPILGVCCCASSSGNRALKDLSRAAARFRRRQELSGVPQVGAETRRCQRIHLRVSCHGQIEAALSQVLVDPLQRGIRRHELHGKNRDQSREGES